MKTKILIITGLWMTAVIPLHAQKTDIEDPYHPVYGFDTYEQENRRINKLEKTKEAEGKIDQQENKTFDIPFASENNTIEISIRNSTTRKMTDIVVSVEGMDNNGFKVMPKKKHITELAPGTKSLVIFSLTVNENTPANETAMLSFKAESSKGNVWEKKMKLKIDAPEQFELGQNYPNPFNPSTTIRYILPEAMQVQVTVYNMLGQRIATLVEEEQQPRRQQVRWDASRFASGLYFYRISAEGVNGKQIVENKKMLLIK